MGPSEEMLMKITVNKIVPHEELGMEVHVNFRDEAQHPHQSAEVIVFVEKLNHPLSEVKSQAIEKARDFLSQMVSSAAQAQGV